jgi:hypothetical protein
MDVPWAAPRLDNSGIVTMHPRERAAQSARIGRHQDEVRARGRWNSPSI